MHIPRCAFNAFVCPHCAFVSAYTQKHLENGTHSDMDERVASKATCRGEYAEREE